MKIEWSKNIVLVVQNWSNRFLESNCLMSIFDSDKIEQNYFYSAVEPEGSNRIDWNWLKLRSGVWSKVRSLSCVFAWTIFPFKNAIFWSSLSGITMKNAAMSTARVRLFRGISSWKNVWKLKYFSALEHSRMLHQNSNRMLMSLDSRNKFCLEHSLDSGDLFPHHPISDFYLEVTGG